MNVLLTGGAGYIGSSTCVELFAANPDCNIIIADDFSNSSPKVLDCLRQITGKDITVYSIDVSDVSEVDKLFAAEHPDAVIHFAGYKSVGESCEIPVDYYRNNLDATITILEAMQKHHCGIIVFSSSATVYGTSGESQYSEDTPLGCVNPYGWTKFMSEQIIRDAAAADPNLSSVLLRYFNPIGAHESGLIGDNPNGIPANLMPYITQVAVGRRPALHIFGNDYDTPDGTGIRDYIHITDLSRGHVAALDFARTNKGCEVFNLGSGRGYSVLEVVNAFQNVTGITIPCEYVARRDGDLPEYFADPSKANRLLKWRAEKTLEDMCRDSWNWQTKNPEGY